MTVTRDPGDISTDPGGKSGVEWTSDVRDSVMALWALNGGLLFDVAGTNDLIATVAIAEGFTSYSDGLRVGFVPLNTNTGAMQINISGVGAKALLDPDGDATSAGAVVAGRYTEAIFSSDDDAFRLVTSGGTTNVTVQGGIILQRSAPARLVTAGGPGTGEVTIGSQNFQCTAAASRVIVEGSVSMVTASGSSDDDGVVVKLYVDGALKQSYTNACEPLQHLATPVYFEYLPADTSSHTYAVVVTSTISATYPKGGNMIWCSEMSPNG